MEFEYNELSKRLREVIAPDDVYIVLSQCLIDSNLFIKSVPDKFYEEIKSNEILRKNILQYIKNMHGIFNCVAENKMLNVYTDED